MESTHLKFSGLSMVVGGALIFLTNAVFNPFLPSGTSPEVFGSDVYLNRLTFAALTVFLLMIGSTGVYKYHAARTKWFGVFAFGLAFTGTCLVFAHEWGQVFFMHTAAVVSPEALLSVDAIEGFNLFAIEGVVVLLSFTVGWLLFSSSLLATKVFPKPGPICVIVGYLVTPALALVISPLWSAIIATGVLGFGFVSLGTTLLRNPGGMARKA